MIVLSCCVALSFGLGGQASDPSLGVPITYETQAVPVSKVLSDIQEKSSTKLSCDSACGSLLVVVRVKNVEVDELLHHLALVVGGHWLPANGTNRLVFSASDAKTEGRDAGARRGARIALALKRALDGQVAEFDEKGAKNLVRRLKVLEISANQSPGSATSFDMAALGTPANRALLKLAADLRSGELGSLVAGERRVFAIAPSPRQSSLGPRAASILQSFAKEQAAWADVISAVGGGEEQHSGTSFEPFAMGAKPPVPDARIELVVLAGAGGTLQLELQAIGRTGGVQRLAILPSLLFWNLGDAHSSTSASTSPVELSIETKRFLQELRRTGYGGGRHAMPNPEFAKEVADLKSHDPLALLPSDGMLTYAKEGDSNLVAWVPDTMADMCYQVALRRDSLSLSQFCSAASGPGGIQFKTSAGWVEARPIDPQSARANKSDRLALRKLLSATNSSGFLTLSAYADYARSANGRHCASLDSLLLSFLDPSASSGVERNNWRSVWALGTLDWRDNQTLEIPFVQLSPEQIAVVEEITFSALIGSGYGSARQVYPLQEPTDFLREGLSMQGRVLVTPSSLSPILAYERYSDGTLSESRVVDAQGAARLIAYDQTSGNTHLFSTGRQSNISLRFVYAANAFNERLLTDVAIPVGAPDVWTKLDPTLRGQIELALSAIQKKSATPERPGVPPPHLVPTW